jgi:branched-chain amino acid transport system substrate-binding protein
MYPEYPHIAFTPTASVDVLGQRVLNEYSKYKFFFRTFITVDYHRYWYPSLGRSLKKIANIKKVALLIEDATWTEPLRNGMPGRFSPLKEGIEKEAGLEIVYEAVVSSREKMFFPIFQALAEKNPDYIFVVCAYMDDATFVKQWAMSPAKNIDFYIAGGAGEMAKFWQISGGAALGLSTPVYSRAALSKKTIPFVDELKKRYNKDPNWVGFGSYDSIGALKAAAEKAKTTNPEALIKALESNEYTGVYGIIKYDKTHSCKGGWPYMDFPTGQYQRGGQLVIWLPDEVRKATNPTKKYIPVKQLREQ